MKVAEGITHQSVASLVQEMADRIDELEKTHEDDTQTYWNQQQRIGYLAEEVETLRDDLDESNRNNNELLAQVAKLEQEIEELTTPHNIPNSADQHQLH